MITQQKLTDKELVNQIALQDERAIATLLHRYKNRIYTVVILLVNDKYIAEDIFQDAFIKIVHTIKQGKYTENGTFIAWAVQIARNLAMDYLRMKKKLPNVTLPNGTDIFSVFNFQEKTNAEQKMISEETGNRVKRLLAYIPDDQREVIVLRLFGNLSFAEIAEKTGVSVNTSLGRMRYGLKALRKEIEERKITL